MRRKRHVPAPVLVALLAGLAGPGCTAAGDGPAAAGARDWDGAVRVDGALRAMFHEGRTGAEVSLEGWLPDPDLVAVGALADLAGEVTLAGGRAYLARPEGADAARTETLQRTDAAAALLVSARVPAWQSLVTEHEIGFEDLDAALRELATAAGIEPGSRFPFLVEGEVRGLSWHVIDGRRLAGGGSSHTDHLAAAVNLHRDRAEALLVGFYSETDERVFTHMGSRTHLHCVLEEPLASGHVDEVTLPAGTRVRFPARPSAERGP
jgi:acetolactate decarboxylase